MILPFYAKAAPLPLLGDSSRATGSSLYSHLSILLSFRLFSSHFVLRNIHCLLPFIRITTTQTVPCLLLVKVKFDAFPYHERVNVIVCLSILLVIQML